MQRLPLLSSVAPRGLLLVACVVLGSGGAVAQMAAPDPLTPKLTTDPRDPPRFQQFNRPALAQLGAPTTFTLPASGAGDTGFDSTNTRKAKGKAKTSSKAKARSDVQAIAHGTAAPVSVSPYQKPASQSGASALAAAPGNPPYEFGPIRRPPKKRKAHTEPEDPYAPLGLRSGGFMLYPAIELIGGYDTNPAHSPSGKGAALYTVAPELRAQSNWSRHEFKGELRGGYTGYSPDETPTLSRPNLNVKADGRIDVSKLTRIDLGSRVLVSTDNPGSPNLQAGLAKLPIFATFGGSAGIGQKFNRFDLSLKGDAERTTYQQSTLTDGSTAGNAFRNYDQYGAIARAGYELFPGVIPFIELGIDERHHDLPTDPNGYQRNSRGVTGKLGTTIDLRGTLTGEVALGYTQRSYEDPRLDKLAGLIGNASLIWTATPLTTVKLSANSSVGESTLAGVSGVLYRDIGLQIDHSFRRWLIGSLKFGFGMDVYQGSNVDPASGIVICECVVSTPGGTVPDRVDRRFSAGVGLTYKLDSMTQLKGEFRQDWIRSNVTGVDYNASIFLLGLRFQK